MDTPTLTPSREVGHPAMAPVIPHLLVSRRRASFMPSSLLLLRMMELLNDVSFAHALDWIVATC